MGMMNGLLIFVSNVIYTSALDSTDVTLATERSAVKPGKGESVRLKEAALPAD
jgi:hypothetical protein